MDECQLQTRKRFRPVKGCNISGRKGMCVELLMWVCHSSGEPWSWTVDLQQDHGRQYTIKQSKEPYAACKFIIFRVSLPYKAS